MLPLNSMENPLGKITDYLGYLKDGVSLANNMRTKETPAVSILTQQLTNKIKSNIFDTEEFGNAEFTGIKKSGNSTEDKLGKDARNFLMGMIEKKYKDKKFKTLDDGSLQIPISYSDYGRNSDGVSISALLGTPVGQNGVTKKDREMIKMLYSSDRPGDEGLIDSGLKLGKSVVNDPVTAMAFTLGGFIATVSPDGNVKITDKYDAERFSKGSGSPARAYKKLRDVLQNLNLFAIEGEGDQTINVDIDLGKLNTKGEND